MFFYARLWRRSGVLTDLEFYELRYSGKAASAVRGTVASVNVRPGKPTWFGVLGDGR